MSDKKLLCPMCEEGHLHSARYAQDFTYRGQTLHMEELEGYECDVCGADPIFEDQIRRNHRRIADAKRSADGLLTGDEIKALRKRFGLSQKQAAALFGGGTNAFSKYERGDVMQSASMDKLMRLTLLDPSQLNRLRQMAGWEPTRTDTNASIQGGERINLRTGQLRPKRRPRTVITVESSEWSRAA